MANFIVVGRTVNRSDPCPHGLTLGKCRDLWCRSRMLDLRRHPDSPLLRAPETLAQAWMKYGVKLCAACGKELPTGTRAKTCSTRCRVALKRTGTAVVAA